jgi:hypothetical protein
MTTTTDPILTGLALLELGQRLGGSTLPLGEYASLVGVECEHQFIALFLADTVLSISEATGFDLASYIDEQRREALATDESPGMA